MRKKRRKTSTLRRKGHHIWENHHEHVCELCTYVCACVLARGGGVRLCASREVCLVLQLLNINTAISPSHWDLIEDVGWCTGTGLGHLYLRSPTVKPL